MIAVYGKNLYLSPCTVPSLGPDRLNDVRKELWDVSTKWYDIGLELGLRTGVLENIRYQSQDAPTCLREMLLHWLKKVEPPPTWEGLACALESRTVGEPRLAEQLRTKYCKTEGAAGQLLYISKGASRRQREVDIQGENTSKKVILELQMFEYAVKS